MGCAQPQLLVRQGAEQAEGGETEVSDAWDVLFTGSFARQLDDKGRLALPSHFRKLLGGRCYLSKGLDQCVSVVPPAVFAAEAAEMTARVRNREVPRDQLRAVASSAFPVDLDKQGRVTLDETLREYAGLNVGQPVVVIGAFDRLEIWSPERYAAENDAGTAGLAGAGLVHGAAIE